MFWIISIGVLIIALIGGIIWQVIDEFSLGSIILIAFSSVALLMLVICVPTISVMNQQSIQTFKQQKEYIESQDDSNAENYAITNKKIELNQWLYNAQYGYVHYKAFTLYDGEVMELEEIR